MKIGTLVRMIVLIFALLNQGLTTIGYEKLPWSESDVGEFFSLLFTVFASAWAWWKDNDFTPKAIDKGKVFELIKLGIVTYESICAKTGIFDPEIQKEYTEAAEGGEGGEGAEEAPPAGFDCFSTESEFPESGRAEEAE
jgi:SPP1 family holin